MTKGGRQNKVMGKLKTIVVLGVAMLCLSPDVHASGLNNRKRSPLTTKGDIFTFSTADARLPISADGSVIVADSTTTTGVAWRALSAGSGTVTNSGTLTSNAVIIGAGTTVVSAITADTAASGHFLASTAASPAFRQIVSTDITVGVLPMARGGTGQSSSTKGDLLASNGTGFNLLAVGSNGTIATADSAQTNGITWATAKNLLPGTTKGDLIVTDGSANNLRVAVGGAATILSADSSTQSGVAWSNSKALLPGTTKGDIIVTDGSAHNKRFAVGANGTILTADSAQTNGINWSTAKSLLPGTTKGDLIVTDGSGHNQRLPVGTDGQILTADASATVGVKWINAPTGGGAGTPGSPAGSIQYNNAGSFAGAAKISTDATGLQLRIGPLTRTGVSLDVNGSIANVPFSLTDGTTIAVDASRSNFFVVQLTGQPRTLSNPTNITVGQKILVVVSQDVTGSRKMGFGTSYKFGSDVPSYDATTTGGSRDYIGLHCFSTVTCDIVSVSKGYR